MERSMRVGVSRNAAGTGSQTILRGFALLRCVLSADSRQATRAVQSHFPGLGRMTKCLSPLTALSADRTVRHVNVSNVLSRDVKVLADYALACHHPGDLPATLTPVGLEAAKLVIAKFSERGMDLSHVLPPDASSYSPIVMCHLIARVMSGFVPMRGNDFGLEGQIDLLAAELVPFSFMLPFLVNDDASAIAVPTARVEDMLQDISKLNQLDAAFGVESRSDQRMTKDVAEDSSRSLNELPSSENRGRMPWKLMLAFLTFQLKLELDALADQRSELQSQAHVTSFGAKLFQQMSLFSTLDSELLALALAIKDSGLVMNPIQILTKWQSIRTGSDTINPASFSVVVRAGNWVLMKGEDAALTVRPGRIA
nr:nonstructural protein [Nelson Bay orthoreovirus]